MTHSPIQAIITITVVNVALFILLGAGPYIHNKWLARNEAGSQNPTPTTRTYQLLRGALVCGAVCVVNGLLATITKAQLNAFNIIGAIGFGLLVAFVRDRLNNEAFSALPGESELQTIQRALNEKTAQLAEANKRVKSAEDLVGIRTGELANANRSLEQKDGVLTQKTKEFDALKKLNEATEKDKITLQDENIRTQKDLDSLSRLNTQLVQNKDELTKDLIEKQRLLGNSTKAVEYQKTIIKDLEAKLEEAKKENEKFKREIEDLRGPSTGSKILNAFGLSPSKPPPPVEQSPAREVHEEPASGRKRFTDDSSQGSDSKETIPFDGGSVVEDALNEIKSSKGSKSVLSAHRKASHKPTDGDKNNSAVENMKKRFEERPRDEAGSNRSASSHEADETAEKTVSPSFADQQARPPLPPKPKKNNESPMKRDESFLSAFKNVGGMPGIDGMGGLGPTDHNSGEYERY